MKALLDINVVMDVLLDRPRLSEASAVIMAQVELSKITGVLCATSITTIHYLISKACGKQAGEEVIKTLLQLYEIAAVNQTVLMQAQTMGFRDYEDSVQYTAARSVNAEVIITRNTKDFTKAELPVVTPEEFIMHYPSVQMV
ncbi:PIN domain-containing protein [Endozoicomonas sp. Mp262]|uniref:PIN domain-containing protein n=1 Tax=Endozoicomonas sp. Mp262 TaxID=2919499 RepID=UPI0021DA77D6